MPSSERSAPRFSTIEDLRALLGRLDGAAVTTTGNWSAGQILYHLATAFELSCTAPKSNGSQRTRLRKLPQRLVALRIGLPRGAQIPANVRETLTPPPDADRAEHLARLHEAIDAFEAWNGGFAEHAYFGPLNHDEWRRFHLRHCELHLAHVVIDADRR